MSLIQYMTATELLEQLRHRIKNLEDENTELKAIRDISDPLTGHGWLAVDFDGTLAFNGELRGDQSMGAPIEAMVKTVKDWIADGLPVCLFTARIAPHDDGRNLMEIREQLRQWCREHLGTVIPITCIKSHRIKNIYDDRAFRVTRNKGIIE